MRQRDASIREHARVQAEITPFNAFYPHVVIDIPIISPQRKPLRMLERSTTRKMILHVPDTRIYS